MSMTRVATRGNNILDLVFSNEVSMVEDLKVLEHFSAGISMCVKNGFL